MPCRYFTMNHDRSTKTTEYPSWSAGTPATIVPEMKTSDINTAATPTDTDLSAAAIRLVFDSLPWRARRAHGQIDDDEEQERQLDGVGRVHLGQEEEHPAPHEGDDGDPRFEQLPQPLRQREQALQVGGDRDDGARNAEPRQQLEPRPLRHAAQRRRRDFGLGQQRHHRGQDFLPVVEVLDVHVVERRRDVLVGNVPSP